MAPASSSMTGVPAQMNFASEEEAVSQVGPTTTTTCFYELQKKPQVWSLSSSEVSCQLLLNDLNQVLSVFLLMTSSAALPTKGFLSYLAPFVYAGRRIAIVGNYWGTRLFVVRWKSKNLAKFRQKFGLFSWLKPGSVEVCVNDNETAFVNERRQVSWNSPWLQRGSWPRKRTKLYSSFP